MNVDFPLYRPVLSYEFARLISTKKMDVAPRESTESRLNSLTLFMATVVYFELSLF